MHFWAKIVAETAGGVVLRMKENEEEIRRITQSVHQQQK